MSRTSNLKNSRGRLLQEGEHVMIGTHEYVVYYDDGRDTASHGQQPVPYWRFKDLDSEVGLTPAAINNYPHTVQSTPANPTPQEEEREQ